MNTVSLNSLWSYLQSLSLTESNKKWLADHLYEAAKGDRQENRTKGLFKITKDDLILSDEILEPVRDITPLPSDFNFDKARIDYLMQKYG